MSELCYQEARMVLASAPSENFDGKLNLKNEKRKLKTTMIDVFHKLFALAGGRNGWGTWPTSAPTKTVLNVTKNISKKKNFVKPFEEERKGI
jgi:hypothetical protein